MEIAPHASVIAHTRGLTRATDFVCRFLHFLSNRRLSSISTSSAFMADNCITIVFYYFFKVCGSDTLKNVIATNNIDSFDLF